MHRSFVFHPILLHVWHCDDRPIVLTCQLSLKQAVRKRVLRAFLIEEQKCVKQAWRGCVVSVDLASSGRENRALWGKAFVLISPRQDMLDS